MNSVIIYGGHYGTTKAYAEKLSEKTGISMMNYKEIKDLSAYEQVIHLGGLYAGGVTGLKNTLKVLPQNTKLVIVTVGIADVTIKENIDNIRQSIRMQVPKDIYEKASIFHLRGGIDYGNLNFLHKTMMKMVYSKVKKMPEEQKTPEDKELMATYNQKVDYMDFDSLEQIIKNIS